MSKSIAFIDLIQRPFTGHLGFLLSCFLLMAGPDFYYFIHVGEYEKIPYYLSRCWFSAYMFVFIYGFIRTIFLKRLFAAVIFIFIFVFYVIDLFCITNLHDRYSYDMAATILGTNANEAGEFLYTYLSLRLLLFIGLSFIACLGLCKYLHSIEQNKFSRVAFLLITVSSAFLSVINNYPLNGLYSKYHSFFEFPELPHLKAHEKDPKIIFEKNLQPRNFVVVIGEAFAKSHSSLYGYKKNTNPFLMKLMNDSSLIVFDHVSSPATHTLQAFQYILNTQQLDKEGLEGFAESVTIANVARHAGYKTYWVSNQSKHGQNDNLVGEFAGLCDKEQFVDNKFAGLNRWSKDGQVLPILESFASEYDSLKFFFVHLMGSHFNCRARYPDEFDVFKKEDYSFLPEHQRKTVAEYDNSVLYNDYVVDSIIRMFKDKESIVVYFPDHGMDIYETSEDWCGHARDSDTTSVFVGRRIPFMIYLSPLYVKNYSQKASQIKKSMHKDFCTDKLIYSIMDMMYIRFENNDDVMKYSILRQ